MTSRPAARLPLVDLARQHASLRPEIDAAISRVFAASDFILGSEVAAFEAEFADFCGVEHVVACGNGTDALEIALACLGVGHGQEVVTVAHTFAATAEAIIRCGARPRFVDVAPDTLLMSLEQVEHAITERTTAIIAVHLYGSCIDMEPLLALARRHRLSVLEDAAQAHGALVNGARAGTLGTVGCFSFYPGKNLGACGDAGAIVTRDASLARCLRHTRDHGRSGKYEHQYVGRNSRMDGLQGAILRVKLRRLQEWNNRRRELVGRYRKLLQDVPEVNVVGTPAGEMAVHHLFVVQVNRRAALQRALDSSGVATGIHYPVPLHMQPAFETSAVTDGELPVTRGAAGRVLSLPLFPEMRESEVDYVVEALATAVLGLKLTGA